MSSIGCAQTDHEGFQHLYDGYLFPQFSREEVCAFTANCPSSDYNYISGLTGQVWVAQNIHGLYYMWYEGYGGGTSRTVPYGSYLNGGKSQVGMATMKAPYFYVRPPVNGQKK